MRHHALLWTHVQECPGLSDVEEVILQQDPYGPASDTSALLRGYGNFRASLPRLGKVLLCSMDASTQLWHLLLNGFKVLSAT